MTDQPDGGVHASYVAHRYAFSPNFRELVDMDADGVLPRLDLINAQRGERFAVNVSRIGLRILDFDANDITFRADFLNTDRQYPSTDSRTS